MIPPIEGWSRVDLGEVVLLVPPEGARAGSIRYLERCTPVAPLAGLVAKHGGGGEVRSSERFFTHEGELAAHVAMTRDDGAGELHLGFVLTEGFYSLVAAEVRRPAELPRYETLVRQLTAGDSHHLGVRPRRALHADPAGWEAVERGLRTDYIGADFPAQPAAVSVYPAMPHSAHDARPLARLLASHGATGPGARVITDHGLRGARWRLATSTRSGCALEREVIVVEHGDYVYALRADGDCEPAVEQILETLIPFPSPSGRREAVIFDHWTN